MESVTLLYPPIHYGFGADDIAEVIALRNNISVPRMKFIRVILNIETPFIFFASSFLNTTIRSMSIISICLIDNAIV